MSVVNPTFGGGTHCVVVLNMSAKVINAVPYASDDASLLFSVNGSKMHVDVHSGGGMKSTGIYGSNASGVSWDSDFGDVGESTTFICTKNN